MDAEHEAFLAEGFAELCQERENNLTAPGQFVVDPGPPAQWQHSNSYADRMAARKTHYGPENVRVSAHAYDHHGNLLPGVVSVWVRHGRGTEHEAPPYRG